jgi:hypothetical protein
VPIGLPNFPADGCEYRKVRISRNEYARLRQCKFIDHVIGRVAQADLLLAVSRPPYESATGPRTGQGKRNSP